MIFRKEEKDEPSVAHSYPYPSLWQPYENGKEGAGEV